MQDYKHVSIFILFYIPFRSFSSVLFHDDTLMYSTIVLTHIRHVDGVHLGELKIVTEILCTKLLQNFFTPEKFA